MTTNDPKKQGLDVQGPAQSQTVACGVQLLFIERQDCGNQGVKALREKGKTMRQIMAATDLSRASVYRALDR